MTPPATTGADATESGLAPAGPPATSPAARTPRPSLPLDSLLLGGRHLRMMSRRPESIVSAIVLPLVFTLLFFTVFQRPMARAGIDYAQYLLPAVIIQAAFYTGGAAAVLAAEETTGGLLRRLRGLPIAPAAPFGGLLIASFARVLISMAVLIPAGMALGFRFEAGFLATAGFVALTCLFAVTLCAGYLSLGLWAGRPEEAEALAGVVYFPLLLLSNAFTTTAAFPDWIAPLVGNQPITRVADALRALSTDGSPATGPVLIALGWLVPLLVLFGVLAARTFGRQR